MTSAPGDVRPVVIDLYCGRFGWGRGFVAEGYRVIGFDIAKVCDPPAGCELILQDVRTLDGRRLRALGPAVIVASSPCQEFSRLQMPWTLARNPPYPALAIELFRAAERIAREAECPIVIENVRNAQKFVGSAVAHWGAQYLWGDVPPLLPAYGGVRFKESRGSKQVAERAEIPFDLAQYMARVFRPAKTDSKGLPDAGAACLLRS